MLDIYEIAEDFMPILKKMAVGRYAVSIAGSVGKGVNDEHSDIDFRLYYDSRISDSIVFEDLRNIFREKAEQYQKRGIKIDDFWPRSIESVDNMLDEWFCGKGEPVKFSWTIWDYYPLTDIQNQFVIEDKHKIIKGWNNRLKIYPEALKEKVINENMKVISYWKNDYHYNNKLIREDMVFLSSLANKVVHQIILILYALNEKYYVGDGNNIRFMKDFKLIPNDFESRIKKILYPGNNAAYLLNQKNMLIEMIGDVEGLVNENYLK